MAITYSDRVRRPLRRESAPIAKYEFPAHVRRVVQARPDLPVKRAGPIDLGREYPLCDYGP